MKGVKMLGLLFVCAMLAISCGQDTEIIESTKETSPRSFLDWDGLYYDPELKIPFGKLGRWTYILDSPDNLKVTAASGGFEEFYVEGERLYGRHPERLYLLQKSGDIYVAQPAWRIGDHPFVLLTMIPDRDVPERVPIGQLGASKYNALIAARNESAIRAREDRPKRW